jgi:hypothetical protein
VSSPPPPPDPWRTPPPGPGEPPQGQPYQPPWGPQQPWLAPPPRKGAGRRWALAALTLGAVIAISVAGTMFFTRGGSGGNQGAPAPPSPSTFGTLPASEVASANDTGPVAVITEDRSCAGWGRINNALAAQEAEGWDQRDPSIPASAWTPDQRAPYLTVGDAMRHAAGQTAALAKLTPHRVMRELYEQATAYWLAYADRIPTLTRADDTLTRVPAAISGALVAICGAIFPYRSAEAWGPLVPATDPPVQAAPPGDPADPQRFLSATSPVCADWATAQSRFVTDTADWRALDPNITAAQWTPQQKAVNDAVAPVMNSYADRVQSLGERSGNPTFQDFAVLTAQYRRAYVLSLPSYTAADNYLASAATYLGAAVKGACRSAGG